jgi:hypothetical protein
MSDLVFQRFAQFRRAIARSQAHHQKAAPLPINDLRSFPSPQPLDRLRDPGEDALLVAS